MGGEFAAAPWTDGTLALAARFSSDGSSVVAVTNGVDRTTTLELPPRSSFILPVTLATDPGNHLVVGYSSAFEISYVVQRFGCVAAE